MSLIENHPDFIPSGLAEGAVTIDVDCPGDPTVSDPRFFTGSRRGAPVTVDQPSDYRLFVYVASPDIIAEKFGSRWYRTTQHERYCDDLGSCGAVTYALYLSPSDLADREFVTYQLTHALGLWPEGEPLPEDDADAELEPLPTYPPDK
jgi:hypothetical protein